MTVLDFFEQTKGKEFIFNGKLIPKAVAYFNFFKHGASLPENLQVRDKAGWFEGKIVDLEAYDKYLYSAEFNF